MNQYEEFHLEAETVLKCIKELRQFGPYLELKRLVLDRDKGVVERRVEAAVRDLVSGNLNQLLKDQGMLEGLRKIDLDEIEKKFKVEAQRIKPNG